MLNQSAISKSPIGRTRMINLDTAFPTLIRIDFYHYNETSYWRRQALAAMENTSLPSDVWDNFTKTSSSHDQSSLYLAYIRDLALKIIYIIMGTVGTLDNLFVIITFALFIKITDKVLAILQYYTTRTNLELSPIKLTLTPYGNF